MLISLNNPKVCRFYLVLSLTSYVALTYMIIRWWMRDADAELRAE